MMTRRSALRALGVSAAALGLAPAWRPRDAAAIAEPPVLPGQVGDAIPYTTASGRAAWRCYVYAGAPADDFHYTHVVVPAALDVTVATPVVMVVHGASATENCIIGPIGTTGIRSGIPLMVDSWLDLGWVVVCPRQGSTVTPTGTGKNPQWGSQRSRAGMCDVWDWAQRACTPHPSGFLVYGVSMGGVGGLNVLIEARRRHIPVAGFLGVDGVTNLRYSAATTPAFARKIRTAYGLTSGCLPGDAQWRAKVDVADGGHDPQIVDLAAIPGVPIRLSASTSDPTVNHDFNTGFFYGRLATAGWPSELSVLWYTQGHCAPKHFRPADTNAFFGRALQRANLAPAAAFTATPVTSGVVVDGGGSTDPDGWIASYLWDFGDGTTAETSAATHQYTDAGTYTVTLTVTDNGGLTATTARSVTIES